MVYDEKEFKLKGDERVLESGREEGVVGRGAGTGEMKMEWEAGREGEIKKNGIGRSE